MYHLVVSEPSLSALSASIDASNTSRPYQPDLFGAAVVDLEHYRRGLLPADMANSIRREMRARGVTQDELAGEIVSQPQLANVLARRFGLSQAVGKRLLEWLRSAAA